MKKVLFSAIVASVAFAGCTNDESLVPPQEIDFQVAKYLSSSRATGSEFTGTFGTYSFGLGDTKDMDNTEIALISGVWKATSGTYHWPATGTVDFISYAPYEDPEIAVAVVVESATAGSLTAVVVADIYDYYFSAKELQGVQQYNQLL